MTRAAILKRLLWKEFREGWPVLSFGLMAPPLLFGALPAVPLLARYWAAYAMAAVIGLPLTIIMLVTNPMAGDRTTRMSHLSASPTDEWLASCFIPMLVFGGVGFWMGMWSSLLVGGAGGREFAYAWAVFAAALFVGLRFLLFLLPAGVAAICGIVWAFWAVASQTPIMTDSLFHLLESSLLSARFNTYACVIGAYASLFVLQRKPQGRTAKLLALTLAVIVAAGPYWGVVRREAEKMTSHRFEPFDIVFAQDFSHSAALDTDKAPPGWARADFKDHRSRLQRTRLFRRDIRLISVSDTQQVFFAQQLGGTGDISIFMWDPRTDKTRTGASIPAARGSLAGRNLLEILGPVTTSGGRWMTESLSDMISGHCGWVSPSGRFVALVLTSPAGTGNDLWIIDLPSRKGAVVIANSFFARQQASWAGDRLILSGLNDIVEVNLKTMKATVRDISFTLEGER